MIWYQPAIDKLLQIHHGPPFELRLWDREQIRIGKDEGPERFVLHFRTRTALVRSLLQSSLGLGESYADGSVVVEGDLEDVLTALGTAYLRLSPPGPVKRLVRKFLIRSLPQEKADVLAWLLTLKP